MRPFAILISMVLPGFGHLALGYLFRGFCIFAAFLLFVNGLIFGGVINPQAHGAPSTTDVALFEVSLWCLTIVWLYAVGTAAFLAMARDPKRIAPRKEALFEEGLRAYLRGDLKMSLEKYREILRLDPFDADTCVHLGTVLLAAGENRRAARCFRRCQSLDTAGKWAWEVERGIQQCKTQPQQMPPAPEKAGA